MTDFINEGVVGDYIVYRDKPLVRKDNMYCYGDMSDDYVLFLMVLTTKKSEINGEEIPDHILAQVMSTDPNKSPLEKLAKQFEKNGLYDAIDFGIIWLDKFNKK